MNFSFYIARRYIFSKKRSHAVNIISAISVGGIAIATAAMICVLSTINGFKDLIGQLFTTFDPQIEITAREGKTFSEADDFIVQVRQHSEVEAVSATLEDHALILFRGRPTVITLKGVDENYSRVTDIDSILYGEGRNRLADVTADYGIPGYNLAMLLGNLDFGEIEICAPRRGEKINLANPIENINAAFLASSGVCFQVHQQRYDDAYMLCSLPFAHKLFEQEGRVGALELRLKEGANVNQVKAELNELGKGRFYVRDRYEQQEDIFNVMNIEKAFSFFFLAFIVLIASFNIIGSVSMLIIDKRDDMVTLRNLGTSESQIARIFLYEGWLITLAGDIMGLLLGLGLCYLQIKFGLIQLGNGEGSFIINQYPVSVHLTDVLLIGITVWAVGALAVAYPVHYLSRRLL